MTHKTRVGETFILLMILIFSGCSISPCGINKTQFINNFENLVEEVNEKKDITDPEWDVYDEKFRAMVEECYDEYEQELTNKEKRKFWLKSLSYYKARLGKGILGGLFSSGKKGLEELKREAEEALEELEE